MLCPNAHRSAAGGRLEAFEIEATPDASTQSSASANLSDAANSSQPPVRFTCSCSLLPIVPAGRNSTAIETWSSSPSFTGQKQFRFSQGVVHRTLIYPDTDGTDGMALA